MSHISIIAPGVNATIQDGGRPWFQHLGVPVSGALDQIALRAANVLVGNPETLGVLEFRLLGPTLEVATDSIRVALAGTRAVIEILGEDPVRIPAHQSVRLNRGQRFRVGALEDSATACLAIEGGFDLPEVYGSQSTYVRARIAGFEGRALLEGDQLPLRQGAVAARAEIRLSDTGYMDASGPVRIVFGPQQDFFTDEAVQTLLSQSYAVSQDADRMGMRLTGPELSHARGYNIVSDGIVTGAVQVPGSGLPIILLADHQTTGGYPKIGTVISADLPRLGRMRPGQEVSFVEIDAAEAEGLRRAQEVEIRRMLASAVPADGWLDTAALYSSNLVSGVVRAGTTEAKATYPDPLSGSE
jgi:biotin-dependent carboxylase-like uncharacterized protein